MTRNCSQFFVQIKTISHIGYHLSATIFRRAIYTRNIVHYFSECLPGPVEHFQIKCGQAYIFLITVIYIPDWNRVYISQVWTILLLQHYSLRPSFQLRSFKQYLGRLGLYQQWYQDIGRITKPLAISQYHCIASTGITL